jgi:hypothetical protein
MIGTLYIAASKGIAYGTRAGRTWVSVREDPALFWISVIFQVACLAFGLGVPLGVACTLRKLKAARAQTTSVAALSNVMSGRAALAEEPPSALVDVAATRSLHRLGSRRDVH